ncbi:hypothetical protein DNAM5_19 [Haloarcula californiae tailed virus 1]|uniref:Uncharacterized protein n=1 Tax=Haloarcula californiae tailed virus 1 TaxID=1273746 RepID=R4TME8_9CAUD|nr:hypothetical protein M202_gp019 [Haloarcula californiae tailed virus 1]AGM11882.1 hypothetical protein DNAM5_19 [Haloarcula californiae tailed virus 1]
MSELRFWRNESGVAHRVVDFEESPRPLYDFIIETACGLEYHVSGDAGFTYDPDLPAYEQVHSLTKSDQCGNCSWEVESDD